MIPLDANNIVVRHCVAGIEAERNGEGDEATARYAEAWEAATGPAERCVAAHYLARVQPDAAGRLHWNALALDLARTDGELDAFIPSLELNLGSAHEELGEIAEASRHYLAASDALQELGDDPLAATLRGPVTRALRRVSAATTPTGGTAPPP